MKITWVYYWANSKNIGIWNIAYERFKIFSYLQEDDQYTDRLFIELKKTKSECELESIQDCYYQAILYHSTNKYLLDVPRQWEYGQMTNQFCITEHEKYQYFLHHELNLLPHISMNTLKLSFAQRLLSGETEPWNFSQHLNISFVCLIERSRNIE